MKRAVLNRIVCLGLVFSMCAQAEYGRAESAHAPTEASDPHAGLNLPEKNPHAMGPGGKNPHEMGSFAARGSKDVSWTLPTGWTELAPTSMRIGNFQYTDAAGAKVEITVSSLPGEAGGLAANFNLWRSQIGLTTLDDAEVLKQSEKIQAGVIDGSLVNFVSTENVIDGKKGRIIGAIHARGSSTWFFKMKGEESAVQSLNEQFMTFLKSVSFKDAASAEVAHK